VPDLELEPRFVGEEMIAMFRMPRIRLVLGAAALLTLLAAPMAGARTVGSAPVLLAGGDWVGAALSWAQNLAGIRHAGHHGRSGNQAPPNQKDGTTTPPPASTQGGGCITPDGRPRPLCEF
jgi:hypothetical protein